MAECRRRLRTRLRGRRNWNCIRSCQRHSYLLIGVCWRLHTGWDAVHHAIAAGYAVFDALVAIWFFVEAPSIFGRDVARKVTAFGGVALIAAAGGCGVL